MNKILFAGLLSVMFTSGVYAADQAPTSQQPVAPAEPSEQAVDLNSFQYESRHDVETTPPNTPPANPQDVQPISADKIKQDVIDHFNSAYQQKQTQVQKLEIDLAAAKNNLAQCDKLTGADKEKCLSDANLLIENLTQRISNLNYDMTIIKNEIKAINGNQ